MTTRIYAWPPVGVQASEWTVIDTINRSRSLLTGRSYESAAGRRRRAAHLEVSALAEGGSGAGYMEVLKRLLEGGVHKVRLFSRPINWHLTAAAEARGRQAFPVEWERAGSDVAWTTPPASVRWMSGTVLQGMPTTSGPMPAVRVTGLEKNRLAARAGEFVRVFNATTGVEATGMVVRDTWADGSGVAVIRLLAPLPFGGRINLGATEGGIFTPQTMPRAVQPTGQDWSYAWDFLEVFADEIAGPIEEINPWS